MCSRLRFSQVKFLTFDDFHEAQIMRTNITTHSAEIVPLQDSSQSKVLSDSEAVKAFERKETDENDAYVVVQMPESGAEFQVSFLKIQHCKDF